MTLLTILTAAVATGSTSNMSHSEIVLLKAVVMAWMVPVSLIGYFSFKDAWEVLMRGGRHTGDVVLDVVCPVVGVAYAATYVALALYFLFLSDAGINKLLSNHFSNNVYIGASASGDVNQDFERNTYHHDSTRSGRVSQSKDEKSVQGIILHSSAQKLKQGVFVIRDERYRSRRLNDYSSRLWNGTGHSLGLRKLRAEESKPALIWVTKVCLKSLQGFMGQQLVSAPFKQVAAQIHHGFLISVEKNKPERLISLVMFDRRFGFGKEAAKKHDDVGELSQFTFFLHKDKLLSGLTGQIKRSAGHGDIRESNHVISYVAHKKILAAGTSMRGSALGAGVVA